MNAASLNPLTFVRGRFQQWWQSRLPLTDSVLLTQRNVYILPTRPGWMLALQQLVQQVHAADPLLNYLQDLMAATRSGRWFLQGLSPRAGIAIMRAARAQAFLSGRDYVAPDDIAAILPQTAAHRLVPVGSAGRGAVGQVRAMLDAVPLP